MSPRIDRPRSSRLTVQDRQDEARLLDMGEYLYRGPSSLPPLILTPEILEDRVVNKGAMFYNINQFAANNTELPSIAGGDGRALDPASSPSSAAAPPAIAHRLRVFQALSPATISTGLAWRGDVNLRPPLWLPVDAPYFDAPGRTL